MPGTVALNSDVCRHYFRIIEAANTLGWEWMGHGTSNSILINRQSEAEERALIGEVVKVITEATGARPRGWLSPALSETVDTLDLLAEAYLRGATIVLSSAAAMSAGSSVMRVYEIFKAGADLGWDRPQRRERRGHRVGSAFASPTAARLHRDGDVVCDREPGVLGRVAGDDGTVVANLDRRF